MRNGSEGPGTVSKGTRTGGKYEWGESIDCLF